ncbi:MAG: carbohydrate ABC transporter permease [Jatrophihabitans sp.]
MTLIDTPPSALDPDPYETAGPAPRPRERGGLIWWPVCIVIAVLMIFPLVMLLVVSLKSAGEFAKNPPTYFPTAPTLDNYQRLDAAGIWHYVANSVGVALVTVVGTVALSTLAGYGFARFRFPFAGGLFMVILLTFMIPFQAILTPLFYILRQLHLQNSLTGLTLVYVTFQLPLSVFLMRNAFAQVPIALEEAAMIDGCGPVRSLTRIMFPIVRPAMITVALFAFFASWNEFLAALVLLSDQSKFTLPVLLTTLQSGRLGTVDWGLLEAGVVVTMLPCVLLFLALQRYYVRGLVAGAVK